MKARASRCMAIAAIVAALSVTAAPVWADPERGEYGGHGEKGEKGGYGQGGGYGGGHGMSGGHMGGWHGSTGHLLRHMLKHEKEIGLKEDQVAKLKEMQLNLDRTRIKSEADIMIAERELKALVEDEKSDLGAIEAKLKQAESMEVALRLEAIKTRKAALALLTPEQREKEKAEHEKMMQEHKMGGPGASGAPHGSSGMMPHPPMKKEEKP
ncbi:MAG TPA: periplasmic heavy metal sensor [Nitrospirales bacterium]|nr:periplasmic heavy metal sensor [Nitrospirales bacterium]